LDGTIRIKLHILFSTEAFFVYRFSLGNYTLIKCLFADAKTLSFGLVRGYQSLPSKGRCLVRGLVVVKVGKKSPFGLDNNNNR
jgi:hypothetical protein